MREMKKATCRYCGMKTDMHVLKKRWVPADDNKMAYEIRCPRCDKTQWVRGQ